MDARPTGRLRGRLTLPFLAFFLMALGFFAALFPVFMDGLESNAGIMSTGSLLMWQFIAPFAGLIMLSVILQKAVAGLS
jgi:uncharacterized membrane protein